MAKIALNLAIKELKIEGYEKVFEFQDKMAELHAIIAIHSTKLGPALGGIRAYSYASFDHALTDVLRLAKGMTYKGAVAETGTGGGKCVVIWDTQKPKPEKLLLAIGEAVNFFNGEYICGEDLGMGLNDVQIVSKKTPFVVGILSPKSSGDPSRFSAFGGFRGIEAAMQKLGSTPSIQGKKVAIQGLGAVGMKLANTLFWSGAELIVSDVDHTLVESAVRDFGATAVSPEKILGVECDILAPCAIGAILNPSTLPHLKCKAVAGIANNQLLSEKEGQELWKKKILYAPDFVINAGGLINVATELEEKGYNPKVARYKVDRIYDLLLTIFTLSEEQREPTYKIAIDLAEYNLKNEIGKRKKKPNLQK